jgi:hypothetical protein
MLIEQPEGALLQLSVSIFHVFLTYIQKMNLHTLLDQIIHYTQHICTCKLN